ncbi:MAG TPA: chemotaxis protein CheW [Gemmatimonadales bacterium]|nr:chemotaxis protein CheW [Gemmatimonadales bacterium]
MNRSASAGASRSEREVLEERARRLARPAADVSPPEERRLLAVTVAGERYAVELRHVAEVTRLRTLTLLPAGEAVIGLTAWRGELLPVLDLRLALGLPASTLTDLRFAVVLTVERDAIAVLVDSADDLIAAGSSPTGDIPEGVAVHRDFVRGITLDARLVLDCERLIKAMAIGREQ